MTQTPKYTILPGSLENENGLITAALYPGTDLSGLKYIRFDINDVDEESKAMKLADCLSRMREDLEAGKPSPASFVSLTSGPAQPKADVSKLRESTRHRIADALRKGM